MDKPIGVFDSGIGGLTVLKELTEMLPHENFIYVADSINAPYGPRTRSEIIKFSSRIIDFLIQKSCKAIVIACNTATAAAVHDMRRKYKIPIIGLEPAVKPACLATKTGHVGVLATAGTFRGNHFKTTSDKYKDYVALHLQVAKGLLELAEKGVFKGPIVEELISRYMAPMHDKNVDQLVLGCTHYPLFKEVISDIAGEQISIIDSGEAVARRTKDVLMTNKILNTESNVQKLRFYSTMGEVALKNVLLNLFEMGQNKPVVEIISI
ncbi:MAG: glutamate racemase [Marinilabiliales bacterium]|nr:MAG: glutamate racemase [Marinilabiliales bacterium]